MISASLFFWIKDIDWTFLDTERTRNIATIIAIFVALFGPFFVGGVTNYRKRKKVAKIIHSHLSMLLEILNRTETELRRNEQTIDSNSPVPFNETRITEMDGFQFIFEDFLLPGFHEFNLDLCPKTIDFFTHYRTNMRTLKKREEICKESSEVKYLPGFRYDTFSKLRNGLIEAIKEWS